MVLKVVDKMKIMNKWINGIVESWEEIIKESGVVPEADIEEAQAEGRSLAPVGDDDKVEYDMIEEAEAAEDKDKEAQAEGRRRALVSNDDKVEYDIIEKAEAAEDTDKEAQAEGRRRALVGDDEDTDQEATATEGDGEELPSEGD